MGNPQIASFVCRSAAKKPWAKSNLAYAVACLFLTASPAVAQVPAAPDQSAPSNTDAIDGLLQLLTGRAVATHPSIRAAEASLRAAGVDIRAAKWQRFPSVSVEGLLVNQSANSKQVQAVVDQPIWTAGRINGGIALARAKRDSSIAAHAEAIQSIALAVSQSYFEVQRWRLRGQILQESLDRQRAMIESMRRRVGQEVSPQSDLELAQTRGLQIEQQLLQSKAQAHSALQRLRELVGDPRVDLQAMPNLVPRGLDFTEDQLIEMAQGFDPRIARLKSEVDIYGAEARVARSSNFPKLSAEYTYSEALGHRFGLVLRAQSSGGLSGFASADAAQLREQAAEMQVESATRELRDQVVLDLQTFNSTREQAASANISSSYAQRVMESYLRQFTSGRRTWLDVMNAVRELTTAQIDALESSVAAKSACARILLRTGIWQQQIKEVQQ